MVNTKSVIAKLKREGKTYEILVDPQKALDFKKGRSISISDVVATDEIFYDAKKGTRASEHELEKIFNTNDKLEICKIIVKEGDVPLTAEMMRAEQEAKRNLIINIIHRTVVDPNTGKPHPSLRIDNAMNEAKIRIDESKNAEQQVNFVIEKIRAIIPIKHEVRELSVKIISQYASRAIPILKQFGKLVKQTWESDGSLVSIIELPGGLQEDFEIALNNIARGTVEIRILKTK